MNHIRRQPGFSLIEALLATGILGVGLVLIAMVFPVGVKLTGIAAERTIGTIAAQEAFAKMHLYGLPELSQWPVTDPADFPYTECAIYSELLRLKYPAMSQAEWEELRLEFLYPSVYIPDGQESQRYHWSALCRMIDEQQVQATVFVTRKVAEGTHFYTPAGDADGLWPSPVRVDVQIGANSRELEVLPGSWGDVVFGFFSDNAIIVADHDGQIYRVQEYKAVGGSIKNTLVLTEDWQPSAGSQVIWVVPPVVGGTRNPVIGVVQKTLTNF